MARSTPSCAPSRSAMRRSRPVSPLRHLDAVSFTYYPSGFVDKSSGYSATAFVDKVNEVIRAAQADGTMKAMSMQSFGTDYATAAPSSTSTRPVRWSRTSTRDRGASR